MIINRIGTYHGAPYRYINYLKENPKIHIRWIHLYNDPMVESLKEEINTLDLKNISFHSISKLNSKYLRLLQRFSLITQRFGILQNRFGLNLFRIILKIIGLDNTTKYFFKDNSSINWSGNNDVDNSLILTAWLKIKFPKIKIIYSYKEHRCNFRIDEGLALMLSDKIIIPAVSSIDSLSEIYKTNFSSKTVFGDEDWRSKSIIEFITNNDSIQKLSSRDKLPHVIFLTRYAEYNETTDIRRGSRINFLTIMRTFAENNIKVHLKAMCICDTIGSGCEISNTPYHKLAEEYPNYVFIEKPMNLNINEDYLALSKFDFGIIHNYKEGEETNNFSKMNIPNRLFEYTAANVKPIIIRNTLLEVEHIILKENYGIIADTYKDAANQMHEKINENSTIKAKYQYSQSFESFMEILFSA